eukprot:TRINITY_DN130_c0_g1_i1.p1 TRINITY_DN130_c0_g1~~TRINITY_DN130_c0_g1_i1.p1  ORF type:complete len:350 (+),score=194.99 TRINITY_DN130_c0_g1_i1:52-1050(+)
MRVIVALLCLAVLALAATHEDAAYLAKFNSYLSRHEKVYEGASFQKRFEIYKNNVKKIEALNVLSAGHATYGENKFTDLSEDEFRAMYLSPITVSAESLDEMRETPALSGDLPTSFDWRTQGAVTPVKNQGQCGSCWSFSTTGAIEGAWFLSGKPLTSLSEQNLVDCSKNCVTFENEEACNEGCNGGLPWAAYQYVIENNGIDTEASYPYKGVDGTCSFNGNNVGARLSNWTAIAADPQAVKQALYSRGPVSVGLNAEWLQFYFGGISNPWLCDPAKIDHAVLIVGWGVKEGTTEEYWIVKNSWGESWGEKGYFRLHFGKCGIENVATVPII